MHSRFYIYAFLALVIFLSGCIGGSGRTQTEIVSKDMLKTKSIDIFPSRDVQPEDTIVIRMEVENVGQEAAYLLVDKNSSSKKDLNWNGDYLLIDHCPSLYNSNSNAGPKDADFQILSGGNCAKIYDTAKDPERKKALIPLVKDSDGKGISVVQDASGKIIGESCYLKVSSGQSHTFQWTMKAPSSAKIADMTQKCIFKFQTAYAAKAVTNTYVYFADPIEVAQRLYTKKEMSLAGDNIASYGPVAVNFVPAEPQPIPARKDGKWTVFLNLLNAGSGIADVSDISLGMPEGMTTANCIVLEGLVDKIKLVHILQDNIEGLPPGLTVRGALKSAPFMEYVSGCKDSTSENCRIVKKYYNMCDKITEQALCESYFPEIVTTLEDTKRKLQIYAGKSSRIPCELTVPDGVTILTPFRFVTTADYTYSIRDDIQITTKPVKEMA